MRAEPRSFNRFIVRDRTSNLLSLLTCGKLVRTDLVTQDIEPWLAERWTVSSDGRTYTFTLRDGVKFSDGEPFTSADVTFSFAAIYDPRVKSPLAESLAVRGAKLEVTAPDSANGRRHLPGAVRSGASAARHLANPAAPQAGPRPRRRHAARCLGPGDAARGARRSRRFRADRISSRRTSGARPQPALLAPRRRQPSAAAARSARSPYRCRPERGDAGARSR